VLRRREEADHENRHGRGPLLARPPGRSSSSAIAISRTTTRPTGGLKAHEQSVRHAAAMTVALVAALTWASVASAVGAVNISSCQTLSTPNTVYKLTTNLTRCGDCLVVANNRITIDLQGHSIIGRCQHSAGVTDGGINRDSIVVPVRPGSPTPAIWSAPPHSVNTRDRAPLLGGPSTADDQRARF
jgi:hypothetical protein